MRLISLAERQQKEEQRRCCGEYSTRRALSGLRFYMSLSISSIYSSIVGKAGKAIRSVYTRRWLGLICGRESCPLQMLMTLAAKYTHTHTHIHIYMHIESERARERERIEIEALALNRWHVQLVTTVELLAEAAGTAANIVDSTAPILFPFPQSVKERELPLYPRVLC